MTNSDSNKNILTNVMHGLILRLARQGIVPRREWERKRGRASEGARVCVCLFECVCVSE